MTGDAAGNSPAEGYGGAPTARRMVLGAQLRRLREAAELSRAEAGFTIRASESKMSRLEAGRVRFKERDVADLLTTYGVNDPVERESFLEMVEQSNQRGWWHRYNDVIPTWFNDFVGLESSASLIQSYEHQFIPGLLQTEDYARAVMTHGRPEYATDEIEQRIDVRRRRQRILARPGAPRLWVVLDESVLQRPIGGRRVLKAQIDALLEATSLPHISVQVLTYEHNTNVAEGAFTMLRFAEPELPTIVYLEHLTGALYLDRPDEVETYGRVLDTLAVDAETPEDSRQMLSKLRADA
ncbi:XRE family transcriptional regulator [Actinobacteria bacterium YIM 96077]|uniref:Transcriptional regulator n=1 Tax=Phytoactinopolyspora halophila TaxID=1981511 RepID=A0A329QJJ2_9ACTN|nr:helix-turn-helix transcriptional regulator [Phytoactinopolyspora halophila]AYY12603.1 XRE family transcriptional regulator [Actinobacteria bacterium YIM 96077]RAW12494.1 transcriptional regulator [Phytoactinopolyspora halophila]